MGGARESRLRRSAYDGGTGAFRKRGRCFRLCSGSALRCMRAGSSGKLGVRDFSQESRELVSAFSRIVAHGYAALRHALVEQRQPLEYTTPHQHEPEDGNLRDGPNDLRNLVARCCQNYVESRSSMHKVVRELNTVTMQHCNPVFYPKKSAISCFCKPKRGERASCKQTSNNRCRTRPLICKAAMMTTYMTGILNDVDGILIDR